LMVSIAGVLIIGFLGRALAKKTSISHIIWLMAFGVLLGPILGLLNRITLLNYLQLVISFVILLVLFNAGLSIRLGRIVHNASRGLILSLTVFLITFLAVSTAMYFLFYEIIPSVLIGLIVGGISLSTVNRRKLTSDRISNMLNLEATIEEPMTIILVLVLIGAIMISGPSLTLGYVSEEIISNFSIGIVLGALVGMAWVPIMSYLQKKKYEYSYVASLAIAFLLYITVQVMGGSGPISALVFGILLANGESIFRSLKYRHSMSFTLTKESKNFNDLVTFLTTSFFFVYFGALVDISNYTAFILGIAIAIIIMLARQLGVRLTLAKSDYTLREKDEMSSMTSRGLGAAAVAALPISYAIAGTSYFIDVVFSVIIFTILFNSVLLHIAARNKEEGNGS
ncbi:MAG: cation:proton antiporter, partial [Candidatus Parvarchaeota archaeon]|nr:cation:proton antiporter [Candidatus Parvarchaeota archaeon]